MATLFTLHTVVVCAYEIKWIRFMIFPVLYNLGLMKVVTELYNTPKYTKNLLLAEN